MSGENVDAKDMLLMVLRAMKPGPRVWDRSLTVMYGLALAGVPDEDCAVLATMVSQNCDERPSGKEVLDMWRTFRDGPQETWVDALSTVRRWMAEYGRFGGRGLMGRAGWMPNALYEGAPAELANAPQALRDVIDSYGGWLSFWDVWNGGEPETTKHAQFREAYKTAEKRRGKEDLRKLAQAHKAMLPLIEQIEGK